MIKSFIFQKTLKFIKLSCWGALVCFVLKMPSTEVKRYIPQPELRFFRHTPNFYSQILFSI